MGSCCSLFTTSTTRLCSALQHQLKKKPTMSQLYYPVLLSNLFLLLTTAQAQVNFFLATQNACNVPNYPCLGVQLCCPLPAVCIPESDSVSLRYICVDAAGFPVNGGASTSLPGGGGISLTTTSVRVSPIVIPTPPPVVVVPSSPGGGSLTPLPPIPSSTSIIPLPSTSIFRFSRSAVPVPTSTTAGGGIGGGNNNGAATPVV